jgi:hypothetical protein
MRTTLDWTREVSARLDNNDAVFCSTRASKGQVVVAARCFRTAQRYSHRSILSTVASSTCSFICKDPAFLDRGSMPGDGSSRIPPPKHVASLINTEKEELHSRPNPFGNPTCTEIDSLPIAVEEGVYDWSLSGLIGRISINHWLSNQTTCGCPAERGRNLIGFLPA